MKKMESFVSLLNYGPYIVQKSFLQFSADVTKKTKAIKSVKAIYIYPSESSPYTLSESYVVYRSLSHRSGDISD